MIWSAVTAPSAEGAYLLAFQISVPRAKLTSDVRIQRPFAYMAGSLKLEILGQSEYLERMAKPFKSRLIAKHSGKTESGVTGGPATSRGMNYQTRYAMVKALELIAHVITSAPLQRATITMEPRKAENDRLTRWDISVTEPDLVIEAKITPSWEDVFEWIDRVRIGASQSARREFHLLYARGASPPITSLERLCRIARESRHDADLFLRLVAQETVLHKNELLTRIGAKPEHLLTRIQLISIDEANLERDIQLRLQFLVEPADIGTLRDFLFRKLASGTSERATFHIPELIREAQAVGVRFRTPGQVEPADLPSLVHAALYTLQFCKTGLPPEVLSTAVGSSLAELEARIAPYLDRGDLTVENGLWVFNPLHSRFSHGDGSQLLARALKLLLDFIRANRATSLGHRQVGNAIALAKACETESPDVVARIFITLDKLLKRTGNKRLVLEAATMAIRAAAKSSRTVAEVQGEAQARICGVSWVFQRIGRLAEAATEAEKSLHQGDAIHWHRNTAFCYKCIGRVCRMEAEQAKQTGNDARFEEKIRESVQWLNKAVEKFSTMVEDGPDKFGPESSEVGDCYSLLGRTYFVAKRHDQAEQMAREAQRRIQDDTSKDYMDLRILFGDIATEKRDPEAAINHYSAALKSVNDDDAERSEIAARGFFARGTCRKKFNLINARSDLQKAIEIWRRLDEPHLAAEAEWHLLLMTNEVPTRHRLYLQSFPAAVRVETIRLYHDKIASMPKGARAQRKELDDHYVRYLVDQAKENVALKYPEW